MATHAPIRVLEHGSVQMLLLVVGGYGASCGNKDRDNDFQFLGGLEGGGRIDLKIPLVSGQ